jgi:hypothetical protein
MPLDWHKSKLLQVFKDFSEQLSDDFIHYDTEQDDGDHYKLPRGPVIILLLQTIESKQLWTTVRRHTDKKYAWYKSQEGQPMPTIINVDPLQSKDHPRPVPSHDLKQPESRKKASGPHGLVHNIESYYDPKKGL